MRVGVVNSILLLRCPKSTRWFVAIIYASAFGRNCTRLDMHAYLERLFVGRQADVIENGLPGSYGLLNLTSTNHSPTSSLMQILYTSSVQPIICIQRFVYVSTVIYSVGSSRPIARAGDHRAPHRVVYPGESILLLDTFRVLVLLVVLVVSCSKLPCNSKNHAQQIRDRPKTHERAEMGDSVTIARQQDDEIASNSNGRRYEDLETFLHEIAVFLFRHAVKLWIWIKAHFSFLSLRITANY